MNENERPFFVSKDVLDTINSFAWFMMDAFWMLNIESLSFAFIFPTVITGLLLCYIEKRASVTFINLSIMSWIGMNVSWMLSERLNNPDFLLLAKAFLALGICFILVSLMVSKSISETFSHFRRFRFIKRK